MRVELLPSVITSVNLLAGMAALIYTLQDNYHLGAAMVLLAAVLDGLDGRVARKMGTSSEFGKQLDSLADLVSFGVAPAILVFAWQLADLGMLGIIATMAFVLCGALRLARFNVLNISDYFVGIPITIAGSLVALLVFWASSLPGAVSAFIVGLLAVMMVSRLKFPKI
ncbi:MAG: CDP-diacylglycerol--serine O-phosphatidyltransferase [Peptococcaceae bacterium BRH_c4b]|nr:MAG: CDP-diacylglycerol--serine O-phosphatidyltransferase [Peptococcaceae bacterium BRH_c4b]